MLLCMGVQAHAQNVAASVSVNTEARQQHISGFGGFSPSPTWSYWLNDSQIDMLYGKGENQLGYNIMRLYIANSEWGWNSAVANAKRAKKYGAYIFASPWSPPASWKDNNSDSKGGALLESRYSDWADFLNRFISKMKDNGVKIDGISLQNEPDYTTDYQSCRWTSDQFIKFLKNYGSKINAQIICPEDVHLTHSYIDPILNDPDACRELDIVGGHFYGWNGASYPLAAEKGKEVWMTEYLINERQQNQNVNIDWQTDAFLFAKSVNDAMLANISAWVHYSLKRYYGCIGDGQFGTKDNQITKRGYILSHFAKYVTGSTRVNHSFSGRGAAGIYGSAYVSVTGDSVVYMIMNPTSNVIDMTFRLPFESKGGLSVVTTEDYNMKKAALSYGAKTDIPVETIPASSVCTFVFARATKGIVSLTSEGAGTTAGAGEFEYGREVSVLAVPAEGSYFSGWYQGGELVSLDPEYTFTVDNDRSLEARFSDVEQSILLARGNDFVATSGTGIYQTGDSVVISAVPAEGYDFVCWTIGTDSIFQNGLKVVAEGHMTYNAVVRIKSFNVSVRAKEECSLTGSGLFEYGSVDTINVVPSWGYELYRWVVNGDSIDTEGNTLHLTIRQETTVEAVLIPSLFHVELVQTLGGDAYFYHLSDRYGVRYMDSVTVIAESTNDHYSFQGWEENFNVVSTDPVYTFQVTGNRTLTALFGLKSFHVNVLTEGHGTAVAESDMVQYRKNAVIAITPEEGYMVEKVLVDGVDVTRSVKDGVLKTVVKADTEIKVYFGIDTSVNAGLKGVVSRRYFNLNGNECSEPDHGPYIVITVWSDGSRTVRKEIKQ